MWPSTSSSRIFGKVACPSGSSCEFPHCFFSHEEANPQADRPEVAFSQTSLNDQPPAKRLRLGHDADQPIAQRSEAPGEATEPQVYTGFNASNTTLKTLQQRDPSNTHLDQAPSNGKASPTLPRTATKPISPPPKKAGKETEPKPEVEVRLMPRKVQSEPTSLVKRIVFLKTLHEYMTPHNSKVATAVKPATKALHLSANQLRKLAVDEEEKIAREAGPVYENVLKQRLVAYKKMPIEQWVQARKEAVAKENGDQPKKPPPKKVDTGMSLKEEVIFLSTLLAPEASLEAHGFVTTEPTHAEIEECRKTLELSGFWEVCDRCNTRFQAFPERREEDGALTTGGKCHYHWGKRTYPKRVQGEDSGPPKYSCCNEPVGSPGCTVGDTHVFKFTDVKRMSLVMPFIKTPENDKVQPQTAVCFDCEMGYTTQGFELLRLTVISWPGHRPLIDVLVRPLGHILDLNTQWSGVTMDQFLNAKPYDPAAPKPNLRDLRIVDSPKDARDLFLAHVSPKTPVLGHALENDLNVIRLIHPTIVDTVILYPTRSGLPYRHGLKTLAKQHLDLDVQQGGAAGHDSYEDAKTTGELIRLTVRQRWKRLQNEGWTIREDGVYPPLPVGMPPSSGAPAVPSMIGMPKIAGKDKKAERRKLEELEGDGTEDGDQAAKK